MIKLYMNKNFSNLAWKRYRAIQFSIYNGLNSGVETLQRPGGIKSNGGFKQWRSHASGAWGMKYEVGPSVRFLDRLRRTTASRRHDVKAV